MAIKLYQRYHLAWQFGLLVTRLSLVQIVIYKIARAKLSGPLYYHQLDNQQFKNTPIPKDKHTKLK